MMKTKQDKDVIDHTSTVYVEIKTKLSWPMGQDVVYHEKQIEIRMWPIV